MQLPDWIVEFLFVGAPRGVVHVLHVGPQERQQEIGTRRMASSEIGRKIVPLNCYDDQQTADRYHLSQLKRVKMTLKNIIEKLVGHVIMKQLTMK